VFGLVSLALLLLAFGARAWFGKTTQIAPLGMEANRYEEL
jgi:hypothetical protein